MPNLSLAEAKKIDGGDLEAVVVSEKNPDGSNWSIKVASLSGTTAPSYADAVKIGAKILQATIVSGKNADGSNWGCKYNLT